GILPLTKVFRCEPRDGISTALLMSAGLTFGPISALFGLTTHIIDQRQYTILVTAVSASAVVPTLIAQRWFHPKPSPIQGQSTSQTSEAMTGPQ
ncbi:MAG: cation:proton antiporter, partial [Ancalomicrobiaceae bacterium]|nr:cation:proton antiporter [Ancalomicrobiaceae bacterium]